MSISKKHHYVPQKALLENFSIGSQGKQIHVYDKQERKSFTQSILNSGSENHFNTFLAESGKKINFESLFDNLDGNFATLTKKIIENENLSCLSKNELQKLADCVAAQYLNLIFSFQIINFERELFINIQL